MCVMDGWDFFLLKNNKCSGGGAARIQHLTLPNPHIDAEWKVLFVWDALISLKFQDCHLDNSSLAHLVELIPLMTNLQNLRIMDNLDLNFKFWIKILHQLSMTSLHLVCS